MKIKLKIWFDKDGELVFGTGKSAILESVQRTGSLNAAAKELDMSYRHAWSYIVSVEKRLGRPLLIKTKGGKEGGGAVLTEFAKDLIDKFKRIDKDVRSFVDRRYKDFFD